MIKRLLMMVLVMMVFSTSIWAKPNKQTVTFYVYLHCDGCVQKVMKNIAFEKGVKDIVCSIPEQTVVVTYDANKTSVEQLQQAFAQIGKPASLTPQNHDTQHDEHNEEHEHHHHH